MPSEPLHLDHDTLRELVNGTACEIGEEFFDMLVKHLARAMGTKCAWVTEWLEEEGQLHALSFWAGDRHITDYKYNVAGTPCEPVIKGRELFHVPDQLIELFPADPDLPSLGAVSYMGIPLMDTDSRLLGHLAILHDKPLSADPRVTAIFNIFAGRAGAQRPATCDPFPDVTVHIVQTETVGPVGTNPRCTAPDPVAAMRVLFCQDSDLTVGTIGELA